MRILALLVGALLLAGCSSSAGGHGGVPTTNATIRKLARQADLAPCPRPGAAATGARALPDVTLSCLGGGRSVPLRRLTGRPTVVNLWASWCQPCRQEIPAVQRFATAARGKVRVLGIDIEDDPPTRGLSFLTDFRVHFASLADPDGETNHRLGLPGLPATLLVRADGSIADVYPRPVTYDTLRRQVARALHVDVPA